MKSLLGVLIGGLLAFAIACGGGARATETMQPKPPGDVRSELQALDLAITADMEKLAEPRPAPPVAACVENCAQQMSGAATTATQEDATCKPGKGDTCSSSCTLKESICKNAGKICSIASDLGGKDAYANEVCNRGSASCEAAKKRCCSCI
ncbi:MAG: hypothetical protein M4D80_02395 [Myxococcota bacterium]|nr:hypothetical protein [Myxococcota bacterium]